MNTIIEVSTDLYGTSYGVALDVRPWHVPRYIVTEMAFPLPLHIRARVTFFGFHPDCGADTFTFRVVVTAVSRGASDPHLVRFAIVDSVLDNMFRPVSEPH